VLASAGYILEAGVQSFKPSPLTAIMAAPPFIAMTRAWYAIPAPVALVLPTSNIISHNLHRSFDIGNYTTTYAPEYFRQHKHAFPPSAKETPFQLAKNTSLGYFAWLVENPSLAADFQAWMTVKQQASPNWVDWFDVEGLILNGFEEHNTQGSSSGDEEEEQAEPVLIVDIGGGEGHYLHAFNRRFPHAPGQRILQDLPHVIDTVSDIPDKTKLMAYDFFTAQPVQGTISPFLLLSPSSFTPLVYRNNPL
jgi:hypothetical protein